MDTDDIAPPPKKTPQPVNLEGLSVAELEARILELEAEIRRTRDAIAVKQKVRGSADALFKR
ncbi:MAG TPA: DUF1192 domain-containing protein [Candidatus Sulfotelmatobacter sp.]|nr:DUF1192 domain-containing protein [Candidatus Sulfotelmatobacter sp.]